MKFVRNLMLFGAALIYLNNTALAQGDIISAADFMKFVKTDKNLVIIDASKKDSYTKMHIKNAVNIPHKTLYKKGDIEALIMEPADLAKIFGSKGVGNNSKIVVYDGGSQKYSSRVYWILKYLGAEDVRILHKDMNEWRKVRVPVTKMPSKINKKTFIPNVNISVYADINDVKNSKSIILDARAADEFDGSADNSEGHIPGALNINYKDFLTESGAFKPKAEIESMLNKKGINSSSNVIGYCHTSVRATVVYAAFVNVLGWNNFKVYDGAYAEWVAKSNKLQTKSGVSVSKKSGTVSGGC
jgi:thiosulfate/3-mercaptopyruvate sulfurtransferase